MNSLNPEIESVAPSAEKPAPSEARLRANRLNAQKSPGPKTTEGKKRSCLNATRHGILDVAEQRELHRVSVPDAWLGLSFGPDDASVYVGGGSKASVYEFKFEPNSGDLSAARTFAASSANDAAQTFIGDVAVSSDGHLLYAADLFGNQIAVINLRSGRLIGRWKCGRRPYRILIAPDSQSLPVSSWADAMIYRYDALNGGKKGVIRTGQHPADILWLNKPATAEDAK